MSFTNAPVTRALVLGLVSSSIAVSLLDLKHYAYILVDLHFWRYHQFWRVFAYQLCYTNSAEVLFASMALYQLRVVERMWGSRKYAVGLPGGGAGQALVVRY
jgi:membrane associated rhomboid family serine protease